MNIKLFVRFFMTAIRKLFLLHAIRILLFLINVFLWLQGFVVPMNFHKQAEQTQPSAEILNQTHEVSTTTEAYKYQFIGIDPNISGFLKPPMPTPAGLTRLPGQFQNVFDVLQEFVKDPGDLNATATIDSIDQTRQISKNNETNVLSSQSSIVITESKDLIGQNSTVAIDPTKRNYLNSTVPIDSKDEIGQNSTTIIDLQDKSTIINDSTNRIGYNSTVIIESIDETGQNTTVTNDSINKNKVNSTTITSDETLQSSEARNLFVVDDVTNGDTNKQNNATKNVTRVAITEEDDNVFPKMTLEQWLNMAGELQQVINNETTDQMTDMVKANNLIQINKPPLNETNTLSAKNNSAKELNEAPLTLSLNTALDDSSNDLLAGFIHTTDRNISNLPVAPNTGEIFTAVGQITVTTISPELSDDSLKQLISTEGLTNQTKNDKTMIIVTSGERVVSSTVLISQKNDTHSGEHFLAPYPPRSANISEGSTIEGQYTLMMTNQNISATSGAPEMNLNETVPTYGSRTIDSSLATKENLNPLQSNGLLETTTAPTALPKDSREKSNNSTLTTVSLTDAIPIDGMNMITVSSPVTNDTIESRKGLIRSTESLPIHLSGLTTDLLDTIDLDHLSTHTNESTKQNGTFLNPIYQFPGEMHPNMDEMKAQFIVDAEQIPFESNADVPKGVLSTLNQHFTDNTTLVPATTGTSVIEQLKMSSLTQPDDLTTIATVSEIVVTSQYINLPKRYPMTNAVDALGIIDVISTPKPETSYSESLGPIIGEIQLAKLSQNNIDGMQGNTHLSNVSNPEKNYYSLRSNLVEHPKESEPTDVDSITHPLESFLIPTNFTPNETKATIIVTTPVSQLTVIPLQTFDATTGFYETTISPPDSETRNISIPFTNNPVSNTGASTIIYSNNLLNGTVQGTEQEKHPISADINKENSNFTTADNFNFQKVESAIISSVDTDQYYSSRPILQANTESGLASNENNSQAKLYPALPENAFITDDPQSTINNIEIMPYANIPNEYPNNNLLKTILNSDGVKISNRTLHIFANRDNSTVLVPSVLNSQNMSNTNDLSTINLDRDNILNTSLFLINGKPYDPKKLFDTIPSISEREKTSFSLNHSIPTNEQDGPLRIPLMIPNAAYIPPTNDTPGIEFTVPLIAENNASLILGLENILLNNSSSKISIETTSVIDINDSIVSSVKQNTSTSLNKLESIPDLFDFNNSTTPLIFSVQETNSPLQNLTNSLVSTIPDNLKNSNYSESEVNVSQVINQNIQVDDTNVFSVYNPSTVGVISVNGPILISESTVDNNTAFINSERQHDSISSPVFISHDSYKNLEPPLVSTYQLTNQNPELANNGSIGKENPSIITESLNLLPKSVIPQIIVDSTHIDENLSSSIQITPNSNNINNIFLKVPFNPEATIRFTRIDNFMHETNRETPNNISVNKEIQLDSLDETNNVSSRIEQPQSPNNNINTTSVLTILNEPKTLSNSYTSTVTDASLPETVITSSNEPVVSFEPKFETNTTSVTNSTFLADEPATTKDTNDLVTTNVIIESENTYKTPAAKNYLHNFENAVVKGFQSMSKVFRPSENSKTSITDELQTPIDLAPLENINSVRSQPVFLSVTPVIDNIPPTPIFNDTFATNTNNNNSFTIQNTSITQSQALENIADVKDAMISTLLKNEPANILENQKNILVPISHQNYETTPFPVVIIANNPDQTFDQRVTEFLLNHNIITTTTRPDVPYLDDVIPYSHVENIYQNLQSVETPIYIYNDVETYVPNTSNVEDPVHSNNMQTNSLGSQPKQKISPSFEKPFNSIAQTNLALSEQPTIFNPNHLGISANVPTTDILKSPQAENFTPSSPANFVVVEPSTIVNSNFVESSTVSPKTAVTIASSVEKLTNYSQANSAVEPQTIVNPSNVVFFENSPTTDVQNLTIMETFNSNLPTNFAEGESQNIINPSYFDPSTTVVPNSLNVGNIKPSLSAPTRADPNPSMAVNVNPFSSANLTGAEPQTILKPSYFELVPNASTTVENIINSQNSQTLMVELYPISSLREASNSSTVGQLGHLSFPTNLADPASPITLISNNTTPFQNTLNLNRSNTLVSENLRSNLIESATINYANYVAPKSANLKNSSLTPSINSESAFFGNDQIQNLPLVKQTFETLAPIVSHNSDPMPNSKYSDSSSTICFNDYVTSNLHANEENTTESVSTQFGSHTNINKVNDADIPTDPFNALSG